MDKDLDWGIIFALVFVAVLASFYLCVVGLAYVSCAGRGSGCGGGGNGDVFMLPFFMSPFGLAAGIAAATIIFINRAKFLSRLGPFMYLALLAVTAAPCLALTFHRGEPFLTSMILLLPVTAPVALSSTVTLLLAVFRPRQGA